MNKKFLANIAVLLVVTRGVFAYLLAPTLNPVISEYSPNTQVELDADQYLSSFLESSLIVDSGIKSNSRSIMPLRDIQSPVLFTLYRSSPNMGSSDKYRDYFQPRKGKRLDETFIGLRALLGMSSDEWVSTSSKKFFVLDVNSGKDMIQKDDATRLLLASKNGSSAEHPFYSYLDNDGTASSELKALLDYQDSLIGVNGPNPQNIAFLAYIPSEKGFYLLDDSRYTSQLKLDFYYLVSNNLGSKWEDYFGSMTNNLKSRYSSIPDSAYGRLTAQQGLRSLTRKVKKILDEEVGDARSKAFELLKDATN